MKIPKSVLIKPTVKLFGGTYQYKVVLRTVAANWFRSENFNKIPDRVADPKIAAKVLPLSNGARYVSLEQTLEYVSALYHILNQDRTSYSTRVEYPILSIYSNDELLIEQLVNVDCTNVKYICQPLAGSTLHTNTIILKRVPFKFKVTIGRTFQSYDSFLKWCEQSEKIRITKATIRNLAKANSFAGGFFYVKDDAALMMVKIFFGNCITKVETIVSQ